MQSLSLWLWHKRIQKINVRKMNEGAAAAAATVNVDCKNRITHVREGRRENRLRVKHFTFKWQWCLCRVHWHREFTICSLHASTIGCMLHATHSNFSVIAVDFPMGARVRLQQTNHFFRARFQLRRRFHSWMKAMQYRDDGAVEPLVIEWRVSKPSLL